MKTTFLSGLILFFVASANAAIEFIGYIVSDKVMTFALVDTTDGRAGYVELGSNFGGFRLAEYAKETETLTLKGKNETLSVKLRPASFTIPAEVTGVEREKQFFQKMREMQASIGPGEKLYFPEDYVATATRFGRVIVFREMKDDVETIVMELPEAMRPAPDNGGEVKKLSFSLQVTRRDKTRVKLIIR